MAEIAETKYGLDGKVTFEQSDGTIKVVDLANLGGAAGAGVTNLTVARNGTTVTIESDTGNDAVIPVATSTQAGIMSAAQAVKLAAQADTPVLSVAARGGNIVLTPTDVGLGSVNNTSDAAKPISTATQLALNQKQNNLVGVTDVPGLSTALAGKQSTISTYTEVPGLTVALNAKQATLTSVADVPNLQVALDAKMGNTVAAVSSVLTATDAAGRANFRNAAYISSHLGAVGSEASMLSLPNVRVGDTLRRTDLTPNVDFRCDALPSSTPANWRNLGATGSANVQAGPLAASATDAPNADAVIEKLAQKSNAIRASAVVPAGVTTLTRSPVTTLGAEAPAGYYNRPLYSDHDTIVNSTGAVDTDYIAVCNTSATPKTITAGALVVTVAPNAWGELSRINGAWADQSARTVSASALPVVAVDTAGGVTSITRAAHAGKRVVIVSTAAGAKASVAIDPWQSGDVIEIQCGADGAAGEVALSAATGALEIYPVARALCGKNTFVRLEFKAGRFEIVDSSFEVFGGQSGLRKTSAWFGGEGILSASQSKYLAGPNMDWYQGNCLDYMQCNHGGPDYQSSPWVVKKYTQSTMGRAKPLNGSGQPINSYGVYSLSLSGIELAYYNDNFVSSELYLGQTNLHASLGFVQSLAANADALDAGEHNWLFAGSPGGLLVCGGKQAAYKGIYGGWTTNGHLIARRSFGVASELIDTANGTHNADVPVGCSNFIQNGPGLGTVAHMMPDMRAADSLCDRSVDVRFSIVQPRDSIQIVGPQVALGTLPNTAGSFFTLRWSPTLLASDGNTGAWHRIG